MTFVLTIRNIREMKRSDAVQHFGTRAALAKALDITVQAIAMWGEQVPRRRAYELQVLTEGRLQARPLEHNQTTRDGSE